MIWLLIGWLLIVATFGPVVTELFIRGSKVNISTVSITQSSFQVPKDVRINCTLFYYIIAATNCI